MTILKEIEKVMADTKAAEIAKGQEFFALEKENIRAKILEQARQNRFDVAIDLRSTDQDFAEAVRAAITADPEFEGIEVSRIISGFSVSKDIFDKYLYVEGVLKLSWYKVLPFISGLEGEFWRVSSGGFSK